MDNKVREILLEVHDTKDVTCNDVNGKLTIIWRDWDKIIKNEPKMVYISSVNPDGIKGPHLHTKRNSCFICIKGKVVFIAKENGKYIEIFASEEKPTIIFIPKNIPSAHVNLSENVSDILTLADVAWKPNDNEMKNVKFDDYNWDKWKIES